MIGNAIFAATVATDGSVIHGGQRWTAYTEGSKVRPGQRWLFRVTPRFGLQAVANFDELDLPAAEQLDRLQARLEQDPQVTWNELLAWATRGKASQHFLRVLLEACMPTAEQLLDQVSTGLAKDPVNAGRAIVNWCMRDPAALATIRTALEATAIADPEAACILARRLEADLLELGDAFDVGVMVSVSPNGRRMCIRAVKNQEAQAPPSRIRIPGLSERSPWPGAPYDIVLRWDDHYRGYVGILDRTPRRAPAHSLVPNADEAPAAALDEVAPESELDVSHAHRSAEPSPPAEEDHDQAAEATA